ncbi:protein ZINC INDUCED FACILITATOR-LIKE 1-like isoform X2 [Triticum dicoccoides]|uniref:protein ZINC INDUCED FACILITATOR-LIKE 1-like isoform X2 n=1 Tax=Triticum dicoccoides TaxID=85692 RepID=UPI00188F3A5E|nr:protein ZINC INDUCED FACILITATOR-LIKE 1-like isoform X2 [Triticum dicoccoides]
MAAMGDTTRNRTFPHGNDNDDATAPPSPSPPEMVYYEGCPGCAMERKKENNTGTPYKEFFYVGVTTLASALPISSLFPFLYFMIQDMHVAKNEQDIGVYAGLLGASYMIGRCFASLFWGVVADRIGRKPIIAFSMFSVVIFNTLFGLSVKYWMAIATRMLLGSMNGMLAPIKAYSVEVCRPEHHALGLSVVSTGWGIGLVVGPAIGGYLAQPAKQYPNLFSENSIFGSCIWLPETLHMHKNLEREVEMVGDSRAAPHREVPHSEKSLYKNWPLMSSIIAYCVFTLHDTAYSEIFSLWAVSEKKYGGLSFSSKDVGQVLAVSGAGLLLYQIFVYRHVHKYLGSIISSRIAAALFIPLLATYPFMTHLSGTKLGLAIYFAAVIKGAFATTILTGTCILQNSAVSQNQRGAANGISTTAMSLFKAIAPAGAGVLFSWAQKRQHAAFFPGDQMIFLILNLVEVIGLVLTFKPFLAVPKQYDFK